MAICRRHLLLSHSPHLCLVLSTMKHETILRLSLVSLCLFCCLFGISKAFFTSPPSRPTLSYPNNRLYSTSPTSDNSNNQEPINGDSNTISYTRTVNGPTGYSTDSGYSQFLTRREQRNRKRLLREKEENEDGYDGFSQKSSLVKRMLKFPLKVGSKALSKRSTEPGTLILVRHGESTWNRNQTFTGWADADLSEQGVREVEHAARLLLEGGYEIDLVFTSRLKRAIRSVWILLQEMNESFIPVFKSWRLNERMYGALTGLSKRETADLLGQELVQSWRGSLYARPPPLKPSDPYWPGRDRKYFDLSAEEIPLTESLHDCMVRTEPVWENKILKEIKQGRNVMVVAHANTLRGLVKTIDNIGDEEIQEVAIPTGIPIIYKFDKDLKSLPPTSGDRQTASQVHMNGLFLEKPGLLKEALIREDEWKQKVPGYDDTMARTKAPMTPLESALYKLAAERELGAWAKTFMDPRKAYEDDGSDGNQGKPMQLVEDDLWDLALQGDAEEDVSLNDDDVVPSIISNVDHCVTAFPTAEVFGVGDVPIRKEPVIVIIRHGKTEHNKLGLFTGWEDAPLAPEGVEEAAEAGRLLKLHGFEFDVVYTSWLGRAIETAWYALNELDSLWLPIVKSWRLNERMYGSLTSLSKNMVKQRHGEDQFKAWRRGYKVRPPPVSSFSQHYPGNDDRYRKYMSDVRYSVSETLIRSIESGKVSLQRKLPKSESLKDCMDRTIPYFTEQIYPQAAEQGKRVLVSSSENAIRGLLMHLCEIPEDRVTELEIPNGLPLIFDIKSKCVKLLDDGTGVDPLEKHNFGKAAKYLFRPCQNEDGSPDEECDIRYMSGLITNGSTKISAEDQAALDAITRRNVSTTSV